MTSIWTKARNGAGDDGTPLRRLKLFQSTTDGFKIAEYDLMLRGPGELFGTRQSGMPPLKLAHLIRDRELIVQARKAAFALAEEDPHLREEDHALIRKKLMSEYRDSFEFLKSN